MIITYMWIVPLLFYYCSFMYCLFLVLNSTLLMKTSPWTVFHTDVLIHPFLIAFSTNTFLSPTTCIKRDSILNYLILPLLYFMSISLSPADRSCCLRMGSQTASGSHGDHYRVGGLCKTSQGVMEFRLLSRTTNMDLTLRTLKLSVCHRPVTYRLFV